MMAPTTLKKKNISTTLNCPISVGYHSELHVAIIFYRRDRFLPTKVILYSLVCILTTYVIWVATNTLSIML